MLGRFYVRPIAFIYGEVARGAIDAGMAGALAGGAIGFTQGEIITGEPGSARRKTHTFQNLKNSKDNAILSALELITSSRPPVAGLTMDRTRIMGVLNVTPDSFSDGGRYSEPDQAMARGAQLAAGGADIVDIGGESTRPGADTIDSEEEMRRVLPVIEGLKGSSVRLSIDTRKADVMRAANQAGAHIINDVSALTYDEESERVAASSQLSVVLVHALGDPKTMQEDPVYDDVLLEVYDYLAARIAACEAANIARRRIIADPGIGFGKRLEHNLALIAGLSLFHSLGVPLSLGASRKSFIGALMGEVDPGRRKVGSLAAALAGAAQGVHILRVHDVAATLQALAVWEAIATGEH